MIGCSSLKCLRSVSLSTELGFTLLLATSQVAPIKLIAAVLMEVAAVLMAAQLAELVKNKRDLRFSRSIIQDGLRDRIFL